MTVLGWALVKPDLQKTSHLSAPSVANHDSSHLISIGALIDALFEVALLGTVMSPSTFAHPDRAAHAGCLPNRAGWNYHHTKRAERQDTSLYFAIRSHQDPVVASSFLHDSRKAFTATDFIISVCILGLAGVPFASKED